LGCCHGGAATPCLVHRCGSDRLEAESSELPWGHRHYVSYGTSIPRVVPTWTWPRLRRSEAGTGASGVHRRPKGGAPPGHRREEGDATAIFFQRLVKWGWSPPP
jgi:hypothetical protein